MVKHAANAVWRRRYASPGNGGDCRRCLLKARATRSFFRTALGRPFTGPAPPPFHPRRLSLGAIYQITSLPHQFCLLPYIIAAPKPHVKTIADKEGLRVFNALAGFCGKLGEPISSQVYDILPSCPNKIFPADNMPTGKESRRRKNSFRLRQPITRSRPLRRNTQEERENG